MKRFLATPLICFVWIALSHVSVYADEQTRSAQEALKAQGFYYGEITGQLDEQTKAAIKRFQIRNGLEVTGVLSPETSKALRGDELESVQPVPDVSPIPKPGPRAPVEKPAVPAAPETPGPKISYADLFRRTPYEEAPREIQREVVKRAKAKLARQNLYDGEINDQPDEELQDAVAQYQRAIGLVDTGRLNISTLKALQLMPGDPGVPFRRSPARVYRGVIVR